MAETKEDKPPIWEAFCKALGTEFRPGKEITGASGISHPVEAIGVDDKDKRLLLISSEHNPRIAALMRVDVQATMNDVRVLVARPLALDLAYAARKMFFTEQGTIDIAALMQLGLLAEKGDQGSDFLKEAYGPTMTSLLDSMALSKLPFRSHIFNLVDQLTSLDWSRVTPIKDTADILQISVDVLTQFSNMDNLAADRKQGICPIPTYELSESDWNLFHRNKDIEEIQARLKALNIYQYFYPPKDLLALGLIDNSISTQSDLLRGMETAEISGHKISDSVLFTNVSAVTDLIENLKAAGYMMDGEFSYELTEEGEKFRQTVKVRPVESLFQKVSQILSVKVNMDLKDLFRSN